MARRYLDATERAVYEALNPRQQRLWLLGRIAAKDAVRQALWSEGHGPMFPVEVPLIDDGAGALRVRSGPAAGRRVSVATAPWIGVAALGTTPLEVECVDDGDRVAARSRLDEKLAAGTSSTVAIDVLPSPVHRLAGSPGTPTPEPAGSHRAGRSQGVSGCPPTRLTTPRSPRRACSRTSAPSSPT